MTHRKTCFFSLSWYLFSILESNVNGKVVDSLKIALVRRDSEIICAKKCPTLAMEEYLKKNNTKEGANSLEESIGKKGFLDYLC